MSKPDADNGLEYDAADKIIRQGVNIATRESLARETEIIERVNRGLGHTKGWVGRKTILRRMNAHRNNGRRLLPFSIQKTWR